MTDMIDRIARIGFVSLVGAILIRLCGDAVAKAHNGRLHASFSEGRARLVLQQPARLGPMHYYGGPHSPMWRGPV
jgi:hypothetical protein